MKKMIIISILIVLASNNTYYFWDGIEKQLIEYLNEN
jgi:hypothetical protein